YLQDRCIILTDAEGGVVVKKVTGGVPQGSILGPTLWNILYDGVLRLELGDGAQLIGFADDLALVVSAKKEAELMAITNVALQKISAWMKQKRLHLAPEKTEAIVLSGRRKL
ncbi:hypothetical protein F3G63_34325, partial [Pseudomonas aeruginosa]